MHHRSDGELRKQYADVGGDDGDPETVHLLRTLAAGYRADPPPGSPPTRADLPLRRTDGRSRFSARRRWSRGFSVSVAAVLVLIAVGATYAISSITNLGKPVDVQSTNQYFPLDNFRRIGQPLAQHGRAELLFIGTLATADGRSAAERWPVVKALEQFGTISNVRAIDRSCNVHQIGPGGCSFPTFDWSHARYRSSYVAFVHADILNAAGNTLQHLTGQELQFYNRYARVPHSPFKHDPYDAFNTVLKSSLSANTTRGLPLVVVGRYLQTQSQVVTSGDFETFPTPQPSSNPQAYVPPSVLPFATVRDSLLHASDPTLSHLVEDVNAEANIITALICHADGKKPTSVCTRPVIKSLLKLVK
jgi:hypothetical protein